MPAHHLDPTLIERLINRLEPWARELDAYAEFADVLYDRDLATARAKTLREAITALSSPQMPEPRQPLTVDDGMRNALSSPPSLDLRQEKKEEEDLTRVDTPKAISGDNPTAAGHKAIRALLSEWRFNAGNMSKARAGTYQKCATQLEQAMSGITTMNDELLEWFLRAHPKEVIEAYAEDGSLHEAITHEIERLQERIDAITEPSRSTEAL